MENIINTPENNRERTVDQPVEEVTNNDVTREEIDMLDRQNEDDQDDVNLHESELDNTDFDGTPLNEGSSRRFNTGSDLDVPGAELDDDDEAVGEEDEENNIYSDSDAE